MDFNLPGMNGVDLLKELALRGLQIPTAVITGRLDCPVASQAKEAGAIAVLGKPFKSAELLPIILLRPAVAQRIGRTRLCGQPKTCSRLMREINLTARHPRRRTSQPGKGLKIYPGILRHMLTLASVPGRNQRPRGMQSSVVALRPTNTTGSSQRFLRRQAKSSPVTEAPELPPWLRADDKTECVR